MMADVFLKLFNISVTAGYLIVAVLLLRLILKKAPKWIRGILWAIVGIRLVFPFSVESVLSLIPSAEFIRPDTVKYDTAPAITSGIPVVDHIVNPVIGAAFTPDPAQSVNPLHVMSEIAGGIWCIGLLAMLLYALVSTLRLRNRIHASVRIQGRIFACDSVQSPFILGVIHPKIYIPSNMDPETANLILSHEEAHIRRGDPFWKLFGFLLLSVYWFHPLMWVGYCMFCRDIELACDEKVIRNLEKDGIADYSEALLKFSVSKKAGIACPIAFGEVGVKERVKSVLTYKKPAFWIIIVAFIACVAVAVCFLTNPKGIGHNANADISFVAHVSDSEKISLAVAGHNLYGREPSITVEWRNLDKDEFNFGFYYCLYHIQGDRAVRMSENDEIIVNDIALVLFGGAFQQVTYDLSMFRFREGETYRLYLNDFQPGGAWIEFVYGTAKTAKSTHIAEPPSLVVSDGKTQITARKGGYSWSYADEDGRYVTTKITDAAASFDVLKNELPVLTARISPMSYKKDNEVILQFDTVYPDLVRVFYYDEVGNEVFLSEGLSFELKEGFFVYKTEAVFGNDRVEYGFAGVWNLPTY